MASGIKTACRRALTAAALLAASATIHALPIVAIDLDPGVVGVQDARNVNVGDSFTVDLVISGAPSINTVDVTISFDPATLDFLSSAAGAFILPPALTFPVLPPPPAGAAGLIVSGLGTSGSGDGVLASFTFDAIAAGNGLLSVSNLVLAFAGAPVTPTSVTGANVSITAATAVPAPATVWLLGFGALAAFGCRQRRRR